VSPTATSPKAIRLALVGNPNVGKTSLFNSLTGLGARVGNYPGVTVEKKRGRLHLGDLEVEVVDLPGIYALAPHAPDEVVAFSVLAESAFEMAIDGIVVILDASNLERNLYLFSQLLSLNLPMTAVLTMVDVALDQNVTIDVAKLSERLGVKVIVMNAARRTGLEDLKAAIKEMDWAASPRHVEGPLMGVSCSAEVRQLQEWLEGRGGPPWSSFMLERALIDQDGYMEQKFHQAFGVDGLTQLQQARLRIGALPVLAAQEARVRYQWVRELLGSNVVSRPDVRVVTLTDRLDRVLSHPVFGLLIFATLMALVFQSIYVWSAPAMDAIDKGFKGLGVAVAAHLPAGALQSLLTDGVIAGLGTVLTFLPQIAVLFFFLGLLEDCGYMARAAFLMDKVMGKAGLSGKSFIPMLSGFACAVPSIMATRTIENRQDRIATILALPLMSCSARLPIYTIMIGAFVPARTFAGFDVRGLVLFAMFMFGVVVAIPIVWVLKQTVLKGAPPTLVLELPSYKAPSLRVVSLRVWQQCRSFLERAGTTILLFAIVIWAGAYFPHRAAAIAPFAGERVAIAATQAPAPERVAKLRANEGAAYIEDSYLARFGKAIQPGFAPLGWDWRITTGMLASFPARETIVATLGTLYSLGDDADEGGLRAALRQAKNSDGRPTFSIAVAVSVMVFFALCLQCGSTLVVMAKETGSWRWPIFAFTYQTALAYIGALIAFQLLKGL
jgi:ferrous iron transport protein B